MTYAQRQIVHVRTWDTKFSITTYTDKPTALAAVCVCVAYTNRILLYYSHTHNRPANKITPHTQPPVESRQSRCRCRRTLCVVCCRCRFIRLRSKGYRASTACLRLPAQHGPSSTTHTHTHAGGNLVREHINRHTHTDRHTAVEQRHSRHSTRDTQLNFIAGGVGARD